MTKLDQLVEQIAFGVDSGKPVRCLGLYLSPEVVYLAESQRGRDGRLSVDHLVRIPIPDEGKKPGATATMNTDFLTDPKKVSGLIRQSMSQLRWNTKNVRVTLSHHLGLLRYFTMPAVDRRFLKNAVPLEAKKYIPIPFDVLSHDYQAVNLPPDAQGKQRVGIVIGVTQKKNIDNVKGLLDSLGLTLESLEVAPLSVLRMWQSIDPAKDAAPFLHVHMDGGSVRVMVIDRGMPVFFREVFLGAEVKTTDMRRIDLTGCLSFVQKQLGVTNVASLRVSGNTPNLYGMQEAFAAETGLNASHQDTAKLLSIKSGDWGGYAALGASTSLPNPPAPPINLAAVDRISEDEKITARDILLIGAAVAAFLGLSGLFKSATYTYRVQELYRYQRQLDPQVKSALGGLSADAIDNNLKDMQTQLDQLQGVIESGKRMKASEIFKEIIAAMPDKLWLDQISISNALLDADKDPFSISMRGHVQDETLAQEQALAFKFKDALQHSEKLGKAFEINLAVQKSSTDDAPGGAAPGLDPTAFAAKVEGRTMFTLDMRAKHGGG